MTRGDYEKIFNWYEEYTRPYIKDNNKIKSMSQVKYAHTRRVVKEMQGITDAESLNTEDSYTAKAIALLHDTGRYEQVRVYGSMQDAKTENHAELGVKEIKKHKVLEFLEEDEQKIIFTAINNHNRLEIEDNLDSRTKMFCDLIRDADKLDIYYVFIKNEFEEKDSKTVFLDLENNGTVNPEIPKQILQEKMIKFNLMESRNDMYLAICAWVYDLNFSYSLKRVADNGYIDKIALNLPDTKEILEAIKKINSVLKN